MRLIVAILIICLAVGVCAQQITQTTHKLGWAGMYSNFDGTLLPDDAATYLYNVDPWSKPGILQKRTRIVAWGTDVGPVYAASSFYYPYYSDGGLLTIRADDSTTGGKFWFTGDDPDSLRGTEVLSGVVPYHTNTHDWLAGDGFMIYCDGKNVPSIFTTRRQVSYNASSDSIAYAPRVLDLGLAAPGQPIVSVIPSDGDSTLTGKYQYAIEYYSKVDSCDDGSTVSTGGLSYPSRTVAPKGEHVVITGAEFIPTPCCSAMALRLWRRPVYENGRTGSWGARLRTGQMTRTDFHGWSVVDSAWDDSTGSMSDPTYTTSAKAYPGQANLNDPDAVDRFNDETAPDSLMWALRYSYYDPVLDLESPLGPPLHWFPVDSISDQLDVYFPLPDTTCRPTHIRLYRSLWDWTLTGGGDRDVLYGLAEFIPSTGAYRITFCTDSLVASDPTDTTSYPWHDSQYFTTALGSPVVLPITNSFRYDLTKIFTDMEYVDGRFWGIEPDYPGRLWYSTANDVGDWDDDNYVALDEHVNDELVAIEPISGRFKDYLYALKHSGIWMVSGAVPDYGYDVTGTADYPVVKMADGVGASHANSVFTFDGVTYFISPSLDIYRLSPAGLEKISDPIRDWCDSLFVSNEHVTDSVITFAMQDAVKFHDRNSRKMLSYNTTHNGWTVEDYWINDSTTINPIGAVRYDPSNSATGFDYYADKMFLDTAIALYSRDREDRAELYAPWAVQLPLFGDDVHQWRANDIQLTLNTNDTTRLRYAVYDDRNRQMFRDSVDIGSESASDLRLMLSPVFAKYLAIRLYGDAGDRKRGQTIRNDISIRNTRFTLDLLGQVPVSASRTDSVLWDSPEGDTSVNVPGS